MDSTLTNHHDDLQLKHPSFLFNTNKWELQICMTKKRLVQIYFFIYLFVYFHTEILEQCNICIFA